MGVHGRHNDVQLLQQPLGVVKPPLRIDLHLRPSQQVDAWMLLLNGTDVPDVL
ncbi:MAG: hypothetical protein BWY88_01436 [Synergistetes bacterium ADurb.Bin520]|nr:MAG: hypothetical protein BWY88_01436 [Synergistetes bacterium ADurb.Bin520]